MDCEREQERTPLEINMMTAHSAAEEANMAPVYGSFADVWEARQDSDVLLEDALGQKASTAIFVHQDDDENEQDMSYGDQHFGIKAFCHNPYSLTQPVTEVVVCLCDTCTSGATTPRATTFESALSSEFMTPEPTYSDSTTAMPLLASAPPMTVRFMPPPPPRMDTCDVLHACGCPDADSAVYMMMTRWYAKVAEVQYHFVAEQDLCPGPNPDEYTFGEWCQKANEWWTKTFSHMQKKTVTPRRSEKFVAPRGRVPQQQRHQGWW